MSKIMWICPHCGTRNLENKCKKCGHELLPIIPKPVQGAKQDKRKIKGVYH